MLRTLCAVVAVLLLSAGATARTLKNAEPTLDIQFPFGSVTGGNGKPLQVVFPGGSTVVGKSGCGGTAVGVEFPGGNTAVRSGDGCRPAAVNVNAPGTQATVTTQPTTVGVTAPGTQATVATQPAASG